MEKTYQDYLEDIVNKRCSFEDIPEEMRTEKLFAELTENIEMFEFEKIPDDFKTYRMCQKAVSSNPEMIRYVPKCFLTEEMCFSALEEDSDAFQYFPKDCITEDMCLMAVRENARNFDFVPDELMEQVGIKMMDIDINLERLPKSISKEDLIDPSTNEKAIQGDIYGFLAKEDTWELVISYKKAKEFVYSGYKDSSYSKIFLPSVGSLYKSKELKWAKVL